MNSREVIAEAARLAAERGWEQGSPQETFLVALVAAIGAFDAYRRMLEAYLKAFPPQVSAGREQR